MAQSHTDHTVRRGAGRPSQQPGCRSDRRIPHGSRDQRSSRCATGSLDRERPSLPIRHGWRAFKKASAEYPFLRAALNEVGAVSWPGGWDGSSSSGGLRHTLLAGSWTPEPTGARRALPFQ
jgi:hypothetical protein